VGRVTAESRAYRVDTAIWDSLDGWGEWVEHGPFGSLVRCRINGVHLRRVLAARRERRMAA